MSTTTHEVEPVEPGGTMPESHVEVHGHQHPTDSKYIKVAIILAAFTALEVGTYFLDDASTTLLVVTLIPLMVIKFGIVAAYFMHLKFDNPMFRRLFVFGLILAVVVYAGVMLTAMEFWSHVYDN
ncbi:MAG TPA: cytochrome C oxidase subunit IV family protein [Acidimicrobiales bacterium]|nr:cytochrome C oxidase subunit IV family protein [Acidimicrobiales bacterium]HLM29177.1 cytochrome C oxidase subunit IV family protein [Acidimicrobiales bacterium]